MLVYLWKGRSVVAREIDEILTVLVLCLHGQLDGPVVIKNAFGGNQRGAIAEGDGVAPVFCDWGCDDGETEKDGAEECVSARHVEWLAYWLAVSILYSDMAKRRMLCGLGLRFGLGPVMGSRGAMHSPPRIHFVGDHDQPRRPSNPRRRSLESPRHKRVTAMLPYASTSESDPALAAFSDEYDLCTPPLSASSSC